MFLRWLPGYPTTVNIIVHTALIVVNDCMPAKADHRRTCAKVKWRRVELLMKLRLRATGCHLPYGITELPSTPRFNPSQTCRPVFDLSTPGDWRLSWTRWPVTHRDDLPDHRQNRTHRRGQDRPWSVVAVQWLQECSMSSNVHDSPFLNHMNTYAIYWTIKSVEHACSNMVSSDALWYARSAFYL